MKGYLPLTFILLGILLWRYTAPASEAVPWMIFGMLFFTFIHVAPTAVKPRAAHFLFLLLQLGVGVLLYAALRPLHPLLASALFVCFMAPAATASPVMVGMLGGDIGFATGYTLLSHMLVCLLAPLLLPYLGGDGVEPFLALSGQIALLVLRMVVSPILLAWVVRYLLGRWHVELDPRRRIPYFLWLFSLLFILGRTVEFVHDEVRAEQSEIFFSFAVGLVACVLQFGLGFVCSRRWGIEVHAARQSLGQKNTTLALWLCIQFLPPIVAPAVAGYIVWQNFFGAYFLHQHSR